MNKISFKEVPNGYKICIEIDCPLANNCLRQLAMQVLTRQHKIVRIVNPLLTQLLEQYEFYRSDPFFNSNLLHRSVPMSVL